MPSVAPPRCTQNISTKRALITAAARRRKTLSRCLWASCPKRSVRALRKIFTATRSARPSLHERQYRLPPRLLRARRIRLCRRGRQYTEKSRVSRLGLHDGKRRDQRLGALGSGNAERNAFFQPSHVRQLRCVPVPLFRRASTSRKMRSRAIRSVSRPYLPASSITFRRR